MSKKYIFSLGSRQSKLGHKEKEGMTQKEWDLRNVNPYDLSEVHSLLQQRENSIPTSKPENVNPYDLMNVHNSIGI